MIRMWFPGRFYDNYNKEPPPKKYRTYTFWGVVPYYYRFLFSDPTLE